MTSYFDPDPTPEYLAGLKPGDFVVVDLSRYGATTAVRRQIDRLTPTQIVVGQDRFRRSDGKGIGYSADRFCSAPSIVSPEQGARLMAKMRRQKVMADLRQGCQMTVEDIARMRVLLDEASKLLVVTEEKPS